jgi:hypothetical protein
MLGMGEESQVALRQSQHRGGRVGFAAGDDKPAGDVVGTVTVLAAGDGVPGVFE